MKLQLSPRLYHRIVRPKWLTEHYIYRHVRRHFALDGRYVLDFGSGTGANCRLFAPTHYLGVDPDTERIEYARRMYPGYAFQVMREGRLPVGDNSLDYILIVAVLHHIDSGQIRAYLKEFRRTLKPTGTIIVMEPCFEDKTPICNTFMRWMDRGKYVRRPAEYIGLFEEHGYACNVLQQFRKCALYRELFFSASPKL